MPDLINITDETVDERLDEGFISDTVTVMDNINTTVNRISGSVQSIDANLSELAYIAIQGCETKDEIQSFLSDLYDTNHKNAQKGFGSSALEAITKLGRIELFRTVGNLLRSEKLALLSEITESIIPQSEPPMPSAAGKIAYFRNSQSDIAFLQFSSIPGKNNAKAVYFSNFPDVCEEVYNRICEYCILPVYNSADGKLRGFYSLIRKYDLHILSVCDIISADKTSSTRFALLTKSNYRRLDELTQLSRDSILELAVVPDVYPTLQDIITAAGFCGLEPTRIDSIPTEDDGVYEINLQFNAKNADLLTFLLFLSFDSPHCSIIGIYKKIKLRKE